MKTSNYSKYFDPHYLSKIKQFSLKIKEIVDSFISGFHKSNRFGINVEFKDHREYNPGDELKYIDWRLYAKTDRYYIKRFDEETKLYIQIIFDMSKSMDFKLKGKWTKFEYSKYIVGSLLYLSTIQHDYVGLSLINNKIMKTYPFENRLFYINELLNELGTLTAKNQSEFKKNLINLSGKIRHRSLIIIISDFLSDIENIIDGIKYLKSERHDIILFVINDEIESNFTFDSKMNIKFIDLETNDFLTVNSNYIKEQYLKVYKNHYEALSNFASKSNIDICYYNTSEAFDLVLYNYLLKRSKYV